MRTSAGRIALFWDKSFLWGLIAHDALVRLSAPFEILTAADIRAGRLDDFAIVVVPGGWASDKFAALGDEGQEHLRAFVASGGGYLGFCGGAGLALSHESGLGLAPVGRKPSRDRLPSFSGPIGLRQADPAHPVFVGVDDGTPANVWWPGQFSIPEDAEVKVLARYGAPASGSFVADLPVEPGIDWEQWEQSYGTNLNPERLAGEPAVIESFYGDGKVLLSYPHFETPGDETGLNMVVNMLGYLGADAGGEGDGRSFASLRMTGLAGMTEGEGMAGSVGTTGFVGPTGYPLPGPPPEGEGDLQAKKATASYGGTAPDELSDAALDLVDFGQRHFLWYWRSDWILQWRRGVKGMEISTLCGMLGRLAALATPSPTLPHEWGREIEGKAEALKGFALPFFEEAKQLLVMERLAMTRGPLSPLKCDDPEIESARARLYSSTKRGGGWYEEILDRVDALLVPLLRASR